LQATLPLLLAAAATFELQLRNARAKTELAQPINSSSAATIAAAKDKAAAKDYFNARFADNLNSIN
jgi:hypothetical protein